MLNKKANKVTVSIPWLHIISEHPFNLSKYDVLFRKSVYNILKPSIFYFYNFFFSFLKIFRWKSYKRIVFSQKSIVIVSHLLNEQQIDFQEDFYFGKLNHNLNKKDLASLLILINQTKLKSKNVNTKFNSSKTQKVVLSNHLGFVKEFRIWKALVFESFGFLLNSFKSRKSFRKFFFFHLAVNTLHGSSFSSLRMYEEVKLLFKLSPPKKLITTFEGHSWERMFYLAARESNPNVTCIGYHHSLVFKHQHAARRKLGALYDPNIIVTAGDISASFFTNSSIALDGIVESIGIHRRKYITNSNLNFLNKTEDYCLVAPDGNLSEIIFLFNFTLKAALTYTKISFILRLHPIVDSSKLIRDNPKFQNLPVNVSFSNSDLDTDLKKSKWILYRGSSTAIYAVIRGVRPLYISKSDEISLDILYGLDKWKRIIKNESELKYFFVNNLKYETEKVNVEFLIAFKYCNTYFKPIDNKLLLSYLTN